MDKCPKCHAPARCGAPDGDFRYVPPKPQRTDIAQSLADALEFVTSAVPIPSAMDIHKARTALANYRKGE